MQSFRLDPYLWIHLAGLAALPILLEVCLLGLAVGYPLLPPVLEVSILAVIGIAPILWMQWTRPFYIFSVMAVALQPEKLSEQQRQMLRFFRTPVAKGITLIAPVILIWALWQLYKLAPVAADFTPISSQLRIVGLLIAAIAFLACNLFLQVPLSVLHLLLVSPQSIETAEAYPLTEIPKDFTLIGLRIPRILPELKATPKPAPVDLPRREAQEEKKGDLEDVAPPDTGIEDWAEDEDAIADLTDADSNEDVWEDAEGAIANTVEPEAEVDAEEEEATAIAELAEPQVTEGSTIVYLSEPESLESAAVESAAGEPENAIAVDELNTAADEAPQGTDPPVFEETITAIAPDTTDETDEVADADAEDAESK